MSQLSPVKVNLSRNFLFDLAFDSLYLIGFLVLRKRLLTTAIYCSGRPSALSLALLNYETKNFGGLTLRQNKYIRQFAIYQMLALASGYGLEAYQQRHLQPLCNSLLFSLTFMFRYQPLATIVASLLGSCATLYRTHLREQANRLG